MAKRKKTMARVDMTSMIDVMFLVLVFFIYCIFNMTIHHGIHVDLPQANGECEKGEVVVITIKPDDTLQLNGVDLSEAELLSQMQECLSANASKAVLISGDKSSSLGVGIALLNKLQALGIEKVSFQVQNTP